MATRKKRLPQTEAPLATQPKAPVRYEDPLQQRAGQKIEEVGRKFEGKGRTLLYALGAIAVLAILIGIFYSYSRRSSAAAQTALGKAIATAQAPVTTQPVPAGVTQKVFKTERERAEASVAEFQAVAEKYGSPVREKAQYFAAVNRLSLDRNAAQQELTSLAGNSGEVGSLAKFALAQAKQADGNLDEAAKLYSELAQLSDPVLSKDTINFALASVYEKQGKRDEAANLYFQIADAASKVKDADGKAVPPTQTAREAKEKLQALNPARAAEIKDPEPTLPEGLNLEK